MPHLDANIPGAGPIAQSCCHTGSQEGQAMARVPVGDLASAGGSEEQADSIGYSIRADFPL